MNEISTKDNVGDSRVNELFWAVKYWVFMDVSQQAEVPDLSGKCSQFFKIAVLSSDFNLLSYALFGWYEVDGGRCDDHLCLLNVTFVMSYLTAINAHQWRGRDRLYSVLR